MFSIRFIVYSFLRVSSMYFFVGCNLVVIIYNIDVCCIVLSLYGVLSFLKNEIIINFGSFYGIIKMFSRIFLGN